MSFFCLFGHVLHTRLFHISLKIVQITGHVEDLKLQDTCTSREAGIKTCSDFFQSV